MTDLYDLCVGSEAVKQEADDSQVPAVKYQLLRGELQGGVGGYHLGSVWAHCKTRRPDQQLQSGVCGWDPPKNQHTQQLQEFKVHHHRFDSKYNHTGDDDNQAEFNLN